MAEKPVTRAEFAAMVQLARTAADLAHAADERSRRNEADISSLRQEMRASLQAQLNEWLAALQQRDAEIAELRAIAEAAGLLLPRRSASSAPLAATTQPRGRQTSTPASSAEIAPVAHRRLTALKGKAAA